MKDKRKFSSEDTSLNDQISLDSKELDGTLKRTEGDITQVSSFVGSRFDLHYYLISFPIIPQLSS